MQQFANCKTEHDKKCLQAESNDRPREKCVQDNKDPAKEQEESVPANTGGPQGAASDANQEAT